MSKPEFVYITYIETTPEKLWQALTNAIHRTLLVRHGCDPTGRSARVSRWSRDGTISDAGKVVESDPPRRLAYTFVNVL